MIVVTDIREMQRLSGEYRAHGKRIGFVPTMGFLHEGHLDLLRLARKRSDVVVLSIFVNPTQFAEGEDLDRYPRDFDRDCHLAEDTGCDVVFAPAAADVYTPNDSTWVYVESLGSTLEGAHRPTHFRGVTTVVTKLFHMVLPHMAVFGQKDAQQAALITRMTRDLHFGIEIVIAPIRREADGLAMSSRNTYLDDQDRHEALALSRALQLAGEAFSRGERNAADLCATVRGEIKLSGYIELDYAAVVDPETFLPIDTYIQNRALIAVAARVGSTRLIDNIILGAEATQS